MDVGSPDNGFEELNDLLKDDDSSLAGEIGLSFIVNNEENASNYGFENLSSSNDFCVDVNEEAQQVPPSLPSDFPYYDFPGFPEKFRFPLQAGFDNVVSDLKDGERLLSPPKDYYQQDKTEEICGSYLSTSPFGVESETLHGDIKADVSEHLLGSPPRQGATQEAEMEDIPASPPHEEMVQGSETKSEHNNQHWITSHAGSRKREMSFSPRKSPQVSKSPDMSLSCLKACSSQQNLGSHKQIHRSSTEMSDLSKRDDPSPHSVRKSSASPWRSGQGSRHVNDSSLKCSSISPRNHYSNQNHRRQGRSLSKSPVRRKESSSRHKRKNHDRSRSRSPYKRDYHRRSPRHRYSPRRKSPLSVNHSNRRSPARRVWSPPHNRSTGLGKPGRNLFVAGFSFLTTERDLERKFSRFGRVRDVRIVRDKSSGDSRGFGFLTIERDEEADAAIRALDKTEWNGRTVLVEKSKSH